MSYVMCYVYVTKQTNGDCVLVPVYVDDHKLPAPQSLRRRRFSLFYFHDGVFCYYLSFI